jgi:hypothetical protein
LLQPLEAAKKHRDLLLRWTREEGIAAYDVQVASDEKFLHIVHSGQNLAADALALDQLPAPVNYYWRVASRTDSGETGPFSDERQFRVLVVPDPVVSNVPEVDDAALLLSWRKAAHAQQYRLSFDKDVATVVPSDDIDLARLSLERPDPGTYYFRVKAISGEGVEGSYGPVQKFDVPDNFDRSFFQMFLVPLLLVL